MGVRWLSKQCSMVLYEFATAADENPDVIGWAPGAGTVLIECKLSRSDFLRDARKTVRSNPRAGMGHRRYFLCPLDLIQAKDLPPKWGLLWASKGQVIVKREARGHPERNLVAEVRFLSSMLRRAQIRVGTRPLSEWLRGENRLKAKRGLSPTHDQVIRKTNRTLPWRRRCAHGTGYTSGSLGRTELSGPKTRR